MPSATTFDVDTPLGAFTFHPLTVGESIRLRPAASKIWGEALPALGSSDAQSTEHGFAWWLAEMQLATTTAPKGFSWTTILNTTDPAMFDTIYATWEAYKTALATFRGDPAPDQTPSGEAAE